MNYDFRIFIIDKGKRILIKEKISFKKPYMYKIEDF